MTVGRRGCTALGRAVNALRNDHAREEDTRPPIAEATGPLSIPGGQGGVLFVLGTQVGSGLPPRDDDAEDRTVDEMN